jgi:methoxymalonate biosynthesis acyl carrier protein
MERPAAQIRNFLGRLFRHSEFTDDDDIFALGFINSLFAIQLIRFVESEFSIEIGDEDLDLANFQSVNSITSFVDRKRTFRAAGA